ncbi:hypothetical protein FRB99_000624 [Tulasnella sp. 403]|nr:hypothetical protein FRB99_000624 [Tulasnella sp. 403]
MTQSTEIADVNPDAITSARLEPVIAHGLRDRRASDRRPSSTSRPPFLTLTPFDSPTKSYMDSALDDHPAKAPTPDIPNSPGDLEITVPSLEYTISTPTRVVHASHTHTHAEPPLPISGIDNSAPSTPLTPREPPLIATRKAERYKFRLVSAFVAFFSAGWADGTPGTIIPHLEVAYGLSHFRVSTLFIAGTCGFGVGTIIMEPLMIVLGRIPLDSPRRTFIPHITLNRFKNTEDVVGHSVSQGRFLTLLVGCLSQILYYTIAVSNPPFWALCIAFCFGGVAISIFSGQMNAYVASASVRTQGRALGNMHGFYGIGAFASPLVCQSLLAAGWAWHQFYWTSFGFSVFNTVLLVAAFHTTKGEYEYEKGLALATSGREIELEERRESGGVSKKDAMPKGTMRAALRLPYVWLFMAFLCFYTGSETTTGGWIVTYLLRQRDANPNTVGYVASGFWGGLAAGRIVLGHASPYIGIRREKHLVHVYIVLSLVMTFIIWFVPSFVGNAFCAAMIGLFLGPIFPTSLALATKILPKEVHLTALAVMSSLASVGSALFPFIAGSGHFLLLVSSIRYLLSWLTFKSTSYTVWYQAAYVGAIMSYAIVVYKSLGVPQPNMTYMRKALADENFQYFTLALFWFFIKPIPLTLVPYATFSLFHALTFTRTNIIPKVFPPTPVPGQPERSTQHGFAKAIHAWVKANYDLAMRYVAWTELLILVRVTVGAVLGFIPFLSSRMPFKNSIFCPLLFAHFVRLRYYHSGFTRQVVYTADAAINQYVNSPGAQPMMRQAWEPLRMAIVRWGGSVIEPQPNAAGGAAGRR